MDRLYRHLWSLKSKIERVRKNVLVVWMIFVRTETSRRGVAWVYEAVEATECFNDIQFSLFLVSIHLSQSSLANEHTCLSQWQDRPELGPVPSGTLLE